MYISQRVISKTVYVIGKFTLLLNKVH